MEYSKRLGDISDDQLQKALDRFNLGKFIDAKPTTSGNFGQNVFLTTTSGEYVFRGKPHYNWQFPSEQFMAELLHKRTNVPVPYPYLVDEQTDIFGWSYVLMPRLHGQQLSFEKMTYSTDIARALGENLTEMQTLTWNYCGQYDLDSRNIKPLDQPWDQWVENKIVELLDKCVEQNYKMPADDVVWVRQLLDQSRDALKIKFMPTFVMHDYQDTNMVVDKINNVWKVTRVFDLMENYFGDGELDLSRMYFAYHQKSVACAHAFLNSYVSKSNPRSGFEQRFPVYMIMDRLGVWEWALRNGKCWWNPNYTFRQWCEPHCALGGN